MHVNDLSIMFKMSAMGDYHGFYFKTDILLLADVFEGLVDMCLEYYEKDPCHYFSSPGLSMGCNA